MTRAVPPQALSLVKQFEGFRSTRYPDPVGLPTIGYGHRLSGPYDPLWNATISQATADELADQDLEATAEQLTEILGEPIVDGLTDGQWAAILDFSYNLGCGRFASSTLCSDIKSGNLSDAAKQFGRWIYGGQPPKVLPGLVTRRTAETECWNT